tara:strand:- start:786 stop:1013 length:228 start_codon:yes stop_codon:yes gene_type:complete
MKKNIYLKLLYLITIIFFTTQSFAYAYLEPGTLSMILQFIVATVAAIISYVTFYYQKVKNFFMKIFKIKKDNNNK